MAGVYSQPPIRNQAGTTTDTPWQPLADCGAGNPFFYHQFADDFDNSLSVAGIWTKTVTGVGTVAHVAGDGGLALFTTAATAPDLASLQLPAANFSLTLGKKLFFECRIQTSDATNAAFRVGLIQTTATPFTATDGIYFDKPTGGLVLNIVSVIASVATTVAIPATAISLANNTNIDLAFYITRQGDILAFADSQLVGLVPQSGTGLQTPPNAGPMARISAPSLTAANLNPTLAVQSGTASAKTMTVDFISVSKER